MGFARVECPRPHPEVSQRLGRRHKTVPHRARQMMLVVRRWLPGVEITVIGDQTLQCPRTGEEPVPAGACAWWPRCGWMRPCMCQLPRAGLAPTGVRGCKGEHLPPLAQVLKDAQTTWQRVRVRWYNGRRRELDVTSGTAVWDRMGQPVLPIRWVLVRDPKGRLEPRAYFSTCPNDRPRAVVQQCIKRWTIETTFEESRTHLGLETQRQWSDRAIERTTPCLFGLYSVVALLAHALHPDGKIPIQRTAWYDKSQATFAEVLAVVRRHLWGDLSYSTSAHAPDLVGIPRSELSRLVQAVCYAH